MSRLKIFILKYFKFETLYPDTHQQGCLIKIIGRLAIKAFKYGKSLLNKNQAVEPCFTSPGLWALA